MPSTLDFRTYVTLEEALTKKLLKAWQLQSAPTYAAITAACNARQWNKARALVPDLDLTEVGTEHKEWIKYLLRSMAIFGAGMVAKGSATFLSTGSFDQTLNQVVSNLLQYLEQDATAQVQAQALQLIAEDEAKSLVQKQEHSHGNTQINLDPKSLAAFMIDAARDQIADKDCAGDGKKESSLNHITVRYGLVNEDLDDLRVYIAGLQPFEVYTGQVMVFPASEHSEGTCPVVVEIISKELHAIHKEIEKYAEFKESSFSEYRPHCSLAYVKPEEAQKYKQLKVEGSAWVYAITISHKSGVQETIPFGMTRKADTSGRFVTPFVSFDDEGNSQLQLIASLNASRLATWGFTAEAEIRGVTRYKLTAILDGRTSRFCRIINGKEFDVVDAREKIVEVLNVQNPNDLKTVQPWPKQTKAALEKFKDMSADELRNLGFHVPPFHPACRTICMLAGKEHQIRTEKPGPVVADQLITPETLKELGITATQKQVDHWNAYLGVSPVQLLASLSGMSPEEILSGKLGKNAVQFLGNGDVGLNARGIMGSVKYAIGTVLDPYTGTYYLSEAELATGDVAAQEAFLRRLFLGMIEAGESTAAKSIVVAVTGNVLTYVKLGFLPNSADWNTIRTQALNELENGELKEVFGSLETDQRVLIQHLLQDMDPASMATLIDLQIDVQGKSIGEWLFENVVKAFSLDLSDAQAVAQAKEYLQ